MELGSASLPLHAPSVIRPVCCIGVHFVKIVLQFHCGRHKIDVSIRIGGARLQAETRACHETSVQTLVRGRPETVQRVCYEAQTVGFLLGCTGCPLM